MCSQLKSELSMASNMETVVNGEEARRPSTRHGVLNDTEWSVAWMKQRVIRDCRLAMK